MRARVRAGGPLRGTVRVPGDKSISHRALILAALSEEVCEVANLAPGADVRSTARCLAALGVPIDGLPPPAFVLRRFRRIARPGRMSPPREADARGPHRASDAAGAQGWSARNGDAAREHASDAEAQRAPADGTTAGADAHKARDATHADEIAHPGREPTDAAARHAAISGEISAHAGREPADAARDASHADEAAHPAHALRVHGAGLHGLHAPAFPLDCGNSGTTMRLLSGVIAGAGLRAILDGDASLRRRPMKRVLAPLRAMGAECRGAPAPGGGEVAPLRFEKAWLAGRHHELAIASAQVKSAILLAGLWADGPTTVREPARSRDHTERMLEAFGAPFSERDGLLRIEPAKRLRAPARLEIPGDPSSAAFLIAAALVVPGSELRLEGVDANPTRAGFLRVLERMGADLALEPEPERAGDPVATITARASRLRATSVEPGEIPSLIDELPLLAAIATRAEGTTEIRGAEELRVKESDRIAAIAAGLRALGADVDELPDGLRVRGPCALRGAAVDAANDHRIAMSLAVAALAAEGETAIDGAEWVDVSYPGFFDLLRRLQEPGAW